MKLYLQYCESSHGGGISPGDEDEAWPCYEDEHTDWHLTKCSLTKTNSWSEEEVDIELTPKIGDIIYVVYVRYTTGNTFGTFYGQWKILGVHYNLSDAQKELESINDGTHPDRYVWTGYFENLEHSDVQAMVLN